ncbi:EscE/YscE/SsaE family type III secretion system needle protein co-chaperone [Yoonia sp. BS5-3]|uniref:EscE/YscE/SsaE family type III secretion system needle protein co-chaperone n=1 Tax=Yoonia phaeophyticola TaxID=3137369 RepID=A0ABZ2V3U1_9RHOB
MSDALDFGMTDLEERLASNEGAEVKTEILGKLAMTGEDIAQKINSGLHPDEFKKAQAVYQALAAAHEIVTVFPTKKPE